MDLAADDANYYKKELDRMNALQEQLKNLRRRPGCGD